MPGSDELLGSSEGSVPGPILDVERRNLLSPGPFSVPSTKNVPFGQ